MLRKGFIPVSKTETLPPACCRPGLTDVAHREFGCVTLQNVHYVTPCWNLLKSTELNSLFNSHFSQRSQDSVRPNDAFSRFTKLAQLPGHSFPSASHAKRFSGWTGGWVVELCCEEASRENSKADSGTHEVDTWYSRHSHSTHLARNMPRHIEHIWCDARNLLDAHRVAALLFEWRERPRWRRATCERVMQHVNAPTPAPMRYPLLCCCSHGGRWY